jgi:sugar phosphate isomerase/epimerase
MKLGFYTYSYIDRLKMEIEPVLESIAVAGFDGIDVSATWGDDLDPALMPASARKRYVQTANRLNLEIEAVVTHLGIVQALRENQPINLHGAVDVARDLGARLVLVHVGFADFIMADTGKVWRQVVEYLQSAASYAETHNVVIAIDGIWSSFLTHSPQLIVQLLEDVNSPAFRHNFDPCYLELAGHNVEQAATLLGSHSVHAHIKDYTGQYPDFQHCIAGEGLLDHTSYVRALAQSGFDRYLVSECFVDAPFEHACSATYQTLAAVLAACGEKK